jgi:peptidoglycan/xylan/chitin deacetylase (PgdA/CDA1 family)
MDYAEAYRADTSLKGRLRRRLVRYVQRRPLARAPGRPMISFSFDDAPKTAADAGAAALEARGLKGTYYVAAGLSATEGAMGLYADAPDYRRLAEAGHELGCHTFSHLDCGKASGARALADVDRNGAALAALGASAPETFAYPYGDVSLGPKRALAPRFTLLRGVHRGLVEAGSDLNQAPAVGIEGDDGEAVADRWMDLALQRKAWLILFTHDVRADPSPWGCTPDAFARLIDRAIRDGFEIVTVAEGARRLGT